jgi:diguanylate cyclase (GGDEF)-like protein
MTIKARLPKFSLVQKLIVGFAATAFLAMLTLLFTFTGLYSLNKVARDIVKNDLVLLRSASMLRQSLLAQEGYAGKFEILKSPEFIDLFNKRESECLKTLQQLEQEKHGAEIAGIVASYRNYLATVQLMFQKDSGALSRHKPAAQRVINAIDTFSANQQLLLNAKLEDADRKEDATVRWTLIFSLTGFILAIGIATLFLFNITTAIIKLKQATHRIAEGDFDYDPQIPPGDEIGDLAHDFIGMANRLKVLEQMNLDASPLTRLPGNIVIERVLNKRVQEGKPFAVCYVDLDNMKAYNDVYGYIKGSDVIKMTGDIILEVVRNNAEKDAFIGHIGGDDFIMVFDEENVSTVCAEVIKKFGEGIVAHYSPQDQARGGIEGIDRYGVPRSFPIMTISIAVVICQEGEYESAVEIAQTTSEIKDYVKGMSGSNFMINRRRKAR